MTGWPEGTGRHVLPRVDSTNAEALRRLAAGEPAPFWILAHRQTAGRGRRGRAWRSGRGDFTASLALTPAGGPQAAALRSVAAALALADAVAALGVAPARLSLKWPNDVLLDGRKLAGILLESTRAGGALGLALGVGVNLGPPPAPATLEPGALPPVSLGQSVGPETLLDVLAPTMAHWEGRLAAEGFAPVRDAWLARAARLGEPIVARLPGREVRGRFRTVDAVGAVVLDTPAGPQALPAADIFF